MTKEPPADAVPPVESYEPVPPPDDTLLAHPGDGDRAAEPDMSPEEGRPGAAADDSASGKDDGSREPEVRPAGGAREDPPAARGDAGESRAQPWPGLAAEDQGWLHPEPAGPAPASPHWTSQDPAHLETVPAAAVPPPGPVKPVRIGRGTGRLSSRLITAYFAGGLALLLAGTVAVFYLAFKAYGGEPGTTVADPRTYPSQSRPSARPPAAAPVSPGSARPSVPLRARFGPQQLANGQSFVVQGRVMPGSGSPSRRASSARAAVMRTR
ncbi:hypothetical protein Asp14428_34880 [Actinoplanes sp. NBRC 14428]|nr:hypothetical protein Asp14428_34880 [Actinoplanes sp. NBRC 14428]